jgi:hypothetical protein
LIFSPFRVAVPTEAFGAGLLVGWTARGDRPEFDIVTGISTGALTAPFAFLGSKYDPALKAVYTTYSRSRSNPYAAYLAAMLWPATHLSLVSLQATSHRIS